ncbi:MAG: type IV toxin-antitoxin system AbiEi family antitoxin domain-containing protein [Solirubrobacteraceae bacterium]|nr:type IV toxin-antitoxin system AbiEi family antitoxin domain-containing protein [Solirubrobacteraceae bacterium]
MDAQDGLVTAADLRALGIDKRAIEGMLKRGELVAVRRGLYRGRGARWDHRAELRSGLIQHGEQARLVLISSLHWQGLLYRPAPVPEVGIPGNGDVRELTGRVLYRTPYARADSLSHDGLACAAPVDALPHLAGHVRGNYATRRALRRAVREAVRRDATVAARLAAVAAGDSRARSSSATHWRPCAAPWS